MKYMKKSIYFLAVTLIIATLVISSTASIPITINNSNANNSVNDYEKSVNAKNGDNFIQRLMRLFSGEIIDVDISDSAAINSSKIDGVPTHDHDGRYYTQAEVDALLSNYTNYGVINDIVLVWSETQSQYVIPTDYYVLDSGILKIEYLPNLVDKLGGMSKTLVETNVKRLVISVEAYSDSEMDTFAGPCFTTPGTLYEDDGKARWDLEFKNADGSSYASTNWKLIIVTTYLI
jgi:hypothetical protein